MTTHVTDTPPSSAPQTPPQAAAADKAANGKPVPDRELLRRFVKLADEAAFAALVRRHSGLVIGVCRRVLRSEHDIEDAFQATFLVLARDAGRIRKSDSLAGWLHGVAYRTSLRAADSKRRRGRLLRELTMIEDTHTPADDSGLLADVEQRHQQQALDEELASLPDNYRAALVLHYLDGKSNQQVADELGLSVTAVEGRLKRGKRELRLRLARRGIGLSVALAAMHAVQSSAQAAPLEPLIARAIDAGLSYAGGEAAGPVYSPEAARLAGQELMTMSTTTTATLAAVILLPLALGFAGHAPVNGPAGSSAVISTTLAQVDASDGSQPLQPASDVQEHVDDVADVEEHVDDDVAADSDVPDEFRTRPQRERAAALVSIEEKNGHVIIKYKTPDGAIDTLEFDKIEFDKQVAAAESHTVDPAHQPPAAGGGFGMGSGGAGSGARMGRARLTTGSDRAGSSEYTSEYDDRMDGGMSAGYGAGSSGRAGGGGAPSPEAIRDYADLPASEQKIADRLKQPTHVEFVDTPLTDAIDFISSHHEIPILIDETALTDVGIPTDEPINLILNGVTLQTALNHILRPLNCTTIIRDEVLEVTTKELADEYLVTRVYDISDLAGIESEQLLKVLQESLPDAEWKDNGGGGTASILGDALVVKQSQSAHRQIVDLLGQLRRHLQQRSQTQTFEEIDESQRRPVDQGRVGGLVIATRTDKSGEVEFVEISIGSDDGLRIGEIVGVFRQMALPSPYDGANSVAMAPVGQIEILFVTSNRAVGRVTSAKNSEMTIERGDQVVWAPIDRDKAIAGQGAATAPRKELTLRIDANGNTHHDGQPLTIAQLRTLLQKEQPALLVLRADRSASSELIKQIIDAAAATVEGIRFALKAADPAADLPAAEAPPRETLLKLRIDRDGQTWYAGREVSLDQIEGFKQKQRPATVELDVDPNAPYKAVSDLIERLKSGDTTPQIRFASPTSEPPPIEDLPAAEPPTDATDPISDAAGAPAGWQAFSDERLTALLEDEKPVLVNFTADWCLVCKQNEKQALYTDATADLLKRHGITALRADYTRPDEQIRTWLQKFGSESVPLAVVFPKGQPDTPIVLDGPITQERLLSVLNSAGEN